MKELKEYRRLLLNRFEAAAREFEAACRAVQDPFAAVDEGGWTVYQIAAHTRDVHVLVYGERALRTVKEDNPEFHSFDGDAHARGHYSADEPLDEMLTGFLESVTELINTLRELPAEAWSRASRHDKLGGGLTPQAWLERGLAHIEEHLATVKKTAT